MTNPMTYAEMLAKLERVIKIDDFYISEGKTDPEYEDYQMDSGQRWEIEAVIDSLRVKVEAENRLKSWLTKLERMIYLDDKIDDSDNEFSLPEKLHPAYREIIEDVIDDIKSKLKDKDHA